MRIKNLFIILLFDVFLVNSQDFGQENSTLQKNLFVYYPLRGSMSSEMQSVLKDITVQRLLLDIALQPRTEGYIDSVLQRTSITIKQLLSLDLIRKDKGIYVINFFLFSSVDERRMREITDSHAKMLTDSLLMHRAEIEATLSRYNLPGVDPHAVLYIILGCFSLDWDGLFLSNERGLIEKPSFFEKIFPRTIMCGWELPELSRKGFYKGSHNSTYGTVRLTSFGDHEIQPRHYFPDILWNRNLYPDTLKMMISDVIGGSSEKSVGKQIGLIMLDLREGKRNLSVLAKAAEVEENRIRKMVELLIKLGYITRIDNYYSSRIPVLSVNDSSLVRIIRSIGFKELQNWFESGYYRLHDELMELSPFKYGLKQADFFYNIWHDIFGSANHMLVEAGLFADPYSNFYGAKGIIPVVFESSLYEEP